jgi:hypothetical protein
VERLNIGVRFDRQPFLGEIAMRTIFGMISGAILTIAVLFVHDSTVTSSITADSAAGEGRVIVNWDVVKDDWRALLTSLRTIKDRAFENPTKVSKLL